MLPGPSPQSTKFDGELIYVDLPCHIISPWTTHFILSLCHIHGSNNLLLHHSFDLVSLLIDYVFMKSLDKCVVIIINLMSSSRISIEFMMRNTILSHDDLSYHRPLYCLTSNTNLFVFCVIPCYATFVLLYLGVLPSFMSRMSWEFHHLLRILGIVILLTITIFLGPRVNSNKWTVLFGFFPSSNPISLKLMVEGSFLGYWLLNHHSDIGRATQPIFRAHLSTNVNCVCLPRAYFLISFDLTNVISLFT